MVVGDFPILRKIVVVTGGGSGIGFAFVRKAVEAGAKVIIADLQLQPVAQEWLDSASKSSAVIFQRCDVTKWDQLHDLVKISITQFNDVPDVYVAGAGVFEPEWSNFWSDLETDRYKEVDINVNHPIKLTRIAMDALARQDKKGVVLSLSSVSGIMGVYPAALYCATKHAIVGFTRSMRAADELEGVKVATILPGLVQTPLWTDRPEIMKNFSYKESRAIMPEDVADAMMDVIQKKEYPGGTVFEINKAGTRVVPDFNYGPPTGEGTSLPPEVIQQLVAPMKKIMDDVRGKKLV